MGWWWWFHQCFNVSSMFHPGILSNPTAHGEVNTCVFFPRNMKISRGIWEQSNDGEIMGLYQHNRENMKGQANMFNGIDYVRCNSHYLSVLYCIVYVFCIYIYIYTHRYICLRVCDIWESLRKQLGSKELYAHKGLCLWYTHFANPFPQPLSSCLAQIG